MGVSEIPKGISAASFSSVWYLMQKKNGTWDELRRLWSYVYTQICYID